MVKQAEQKDIPVIEEILLDAVNWLQSIGMDNKWTNRSVLWENLSKEYNITDFYIAYEGQQPAACMALTDMDVTYWPQIPKGTSLYLHKLAVKRQFAGNGYSKVLIDFAKQKGIERKIKTLRLDCNKNNTKLRAIYEKQGFQFIENESIAREKGMALYVNQL